MRVEKEREKTISDSSYAQLNEVIRVEIKFVIKDNRSICWMCYYLRIHFILYSVWQLTIFYKFYPFDWSHCYHDMFLVQIHTHLSFKNEIMVETFHGSMSISVRVREKTLIWQDDNKMTQKHWSLYSLQNKNVQKRPRVSTHERYTHTIKTKRQRNNHQSNWSTLCCAVQCAPMSICNG